MYYTRRKLCWSGKNTEYIFDEKTWAAAGHFRKSPARMFPKRTAVKGRMKNMAGAEKDCFES